MPYIDNIIKALNEDLLKKMDCLTAGPFARDVNFFDRLMCRYNSTSGREIVDVIRFREKFKFGLRPETSLIEFILILGGFLFHLRKTNEQRFKQKYAKMFDEIFNKEIDSIGILIQELLFKLNEQELNYAFKLMDEIAKNISDYKNDRTREQGNMLTMHSAVVSVFCNAETREMFTFLKKEDRHQLKNAVTINHLEYSIKQNIMFYADQMETYKSLKLD